MVAWIHLPMWKRLCFTKNLYTYHLLYMFIHPNCPGTDSKRTVYSSYFIFVHKLTKLYHFSAPLDRIRWKFDYNMLSSLQWSNIILPNYYAIRDIIPRGPHTTFSVIRRDKLYRFGIVILFRDSYTMKLCLWTFTNLYTSYNETSYNKTMPKHAFRYTTYK